MYFPTANITVDPWLPPLVAFAISLFTSMGGVSGAFLLLPFQVSILGFTSPAVSATNQLFNIVAIPSGVYRYLREGRMVWPLTWVVIIGTLPGVLLGAVIRVRYLPNPKNFTLFAGLVLLYIGGRLVKSLLFPSRPLSGAEGRSLSGAEGQSHTTPEDEFQAMVRRFQKDDANLPRVVVREYSLTRIRYDFYGQSYSIPTIGVSTLSFVVGIVGGVYGIGGGAIIAPFFVTVFGLPVYTVAGAALMGTFVTSVAGVAFYQLIAPWYPGMAVAPDWLLGLLFGLGGCAGMYCGARLQKFMPARGIKWLLAFSILVPALKYLTDFFR
ncbi:MAG: sulfite exporter TauE/SafE family protein [Proteobacteria bacterium]|nr:sulfite exporter TauE/SafE family protein [Desulfobulbaceae bacterium]MBU4152631.1 sulfite exporter TauE/SafE family protein [Pseudomonadota bacterium]MDP2107168.1 sulfite exporter TauE/SafE family protein [Desulfobulbaceae bacterium]